MKRETEVVDVVIDARLLAIVDDLLARTITPLHDAELALPPLDGA